MELPGCFSAMFKGSGESGLKVLWVNKALGTGLTLTLHLLFFVFVCVLFRCQWEVLPWWIACSKGPKYFLGRRTRATVMCANSAPLSGMWEHLSCSPVALMHELYNCGAFWAGCFIPSLAVTSVDPCGDIKDEMNFCVLGYVYYEWIVTQQPHRNQILDGLPLPPGTCVTVSFNLGSNFKSNFDVNPLGGGKKER